jgi:chemotaxis signal transduction protein
MAVAVRSVAAVLETESLAPLVWRPPSVVGICVYHRDVVPVISLGPGEGDPNAHPVNGASPRAAALSASSTGAAEDDDEARGIVLVLRSEHDAWALRIDRAGTFIKRARPELHPPRSGAQGAVFIGAVNCDGKCYAILDVEATWRGLRSTVVRWYGLINEPGFYAAVPLGENARESALNETV